MPGGRNLLVPPAPKNNNKKKATASPSKTVTDPSASASSAPAKDVPEAPAPTQTTPTPPSATSAGESAIAKPTPPEGAKLTAQALAAVVTTATAPSSGMPAAPPLQPADLSPATRGLGKDKLPVIDPAGPRSTGQHFGRLRRAVKEFDNVWHDANNNVASVLDTRKQLFEELLWEHQELSEAHIKCQALPEASFEDLSAQLTALKAEKEQLAKEHHQALDAQRTHSSELKDQLMES
nr:formin-like protein 14 [Lolium perenne]